MIPFDDDSPPPPEKAKFALSTSNLVYLGVVTVLHGCGLRSAKTPDQVGEFVGTIVGYLIISAFFAWVFFFLFRRSRTASSITFNVVMTLAALGQLVQHGRSLQQDRLLKEMEAERKVLRSELADTDDPNQALEKYGNSVRDKFGKLAETGDGDEKVFYRLMQEYLEETMTAEQKFSAAQTAVESPDILDYSRLTETAEFDRQRKVINAYIDETRKYGEHVTTMRERLQKRLEVLGPNNQMVRGALRGADQKLATRLPILKPLVAAHGEYGHCMLEILDLLEKNRGSWTFENDELIIDDDRVREQFNGIFARFAERQETINRLAAEIRKTI